MKQKPDAEEFSRIILWDLCGLRAEMRIVMSMFARSVEPDIAKADAIYARWIEQSVELQKKLYAEAVDRVGIQPSKE